MADDLSVAFERLRTSTQRLNKICDDAAHTVRELEEFLEEAHVGIDEFVLVESKAHGEYAEIHIDTYLNYERYKQGKYRITLDFVRDGEHDGDTTLAWSEATRELKIQSFEKLPELMVKIAQKVDDRVANAERIVEDVRVKLSLPKKRKGSDK